MTNYPIINNGSFSAKNVKIKGTGSLTIEAGGTLTVTGKLEFLASTATVTQTGGTLNVRDLKFTNGGTYNQSGSGSQLKISHNYRNNGGGTFNSTGGTIQFTGSGGRGPRFDSGTNQFYNVIIDNGVDPKFDRGAGGNIKVAGNFTNNNPNLNVTTATFTFNGSGDQTIYSASTPLPGNHTFGNLITDKPSGSFKLLSDVSVKTSFTPTQGHLDINGNVLYVNDIVYNGPFPVELVLFTARISGTKVILDWLTATEVNNYGFEVERKVNSKSASGGTAGNWEKIGFVEGHGNSNSPKEYSFIDDNALSRKYSYRLKQIDNDGTFEYSKIIEINIDAPAGYKLSQNYPNPFNPTTTINFILPESEVVKIVVYDILGTEVKTLVDEFKEAGIHTINFDASEFASGTYVYRIETSNFVEIKKMLLIK